MFRYVICFLLVLGITPAASGRLIDDYAVGPIVVQRTGATSVTDEQTSLDPTRVLGGKRFIEVGTFGTATQTATIDTVARKFNFSTSGITNGYLTLRYGSVAEPLNLDLTADGSQFFAITMTDITGSSTPSMRIYGAGAEQFVSLNASVISPSDIVKLKIPFSGLNPAIVQDLDILEIGVGRFPQNRQFSILRISTVVPEPSTILLAGASGLLLICRRHRSRKS